MGRRDRHISGASPQAGTQPTKRPYPKFLKYALAFLLGAAAAGGTALVLHEYASSQNLASAECRWL